MKTAFITGATSGIGRATARLLGENGFRIIGCGRRTDRLQDLQNALKDLTEIKTLNFDVRDKDAVFEAVNSLPRDWKNIDLLINNAGNAHGLSSIDEGSLQDWDAMIDINVKGLLYVSRAIMPGMVERKSGHIINIGSIAGREVYPNGNVYSGTKYAVDAISKAMRIDLNAHGIKVAQVAPGLVETEFSMVRFKGDEARSKMVYESIDALKAEDIAELILFMATRPAHVNIADVLILPTAQANTSVVNKKS